MRKPHIHRTFAPIHFEDLDPHRFEDLIRELVYDFRNWQVVEATGRSGDDNGIDIRGYERIGQWQEDELTDLENVSPMDGNLWIIQCKREKQIGPKRLSGIIDVCVSPQEPPYGFILAAPCNFSKQAYDVFRIRLREMGVMEFYLWGKAELEDMLHMPKNDRVLITFFGISLVARKRLIKTEVRGITTIKNKVLKNLGLADFRPTKILVRDINDIHYPYREKYLNFDANPHWREYDVQEHHVHGLVCCEHEYYAYFNEENNTYDFWPEADLLYREDRVHQMDDAYFKFYHERKEAAEELWDYLPNRYKAKLRVYSLLRYDNIDLIDEQGDIVYQCPHFFVQYHSGKPFAKSILHIEKDFKNIRVDEGVYKRIDIFEQNNKCSKRIKPQIIKQAFQPSSLIKALFKAPHENLNTIYFVDNTYGFLKVGDIAEMLLNDKNENFFILITFIQTIEITTDLISTSLYYRLQEQLQQVEIGTRVTALEFKKLYRYQLKL
jgi:hypothetical protein